MRAIQNYILTLKFEKIKIHKRFLKHTDLQSQANYDDKTNSKKNLHILEDGASGVQIGDIDQVIV